MTTFYDHKNRPHSLTGIDSCFTYLHSLTDNSAIKISNEHFANSFKDKPNERKVPLDAGWPIGEAA